MRAPLEAGLGGFRISGRLKEWAVQGESSSRGGQIKERVMSGEDCQNKVDFLGGLLEERAAQEEGGSKGGQLK